MAKIIPFPKPKTQEEQAQELDDLIVDISLDLSLGIYNRLDFDLPEEYAFHDTEVQKSLILIHEAIKAAVSRAYGREHYLHQVAEDLIQIDGSDIRFQIEE